MADYYPHFSVLKNESIKFLTDHLDQNAHCLLADLTFGAGGHSIALAQLSKNIHLWALDQDPDAIKHGKKIIEENSLQKKIKLIHNNFGNFPQIAKRQKFHGILLDLGVSTHQIKDESRGLSFRKDGPLDMRMDQSNDQQQNAHDIVNQASACELQNIFFNFGEEKFAMRIAKKIVEVRDEGEITTTSMLENIIFHCYPQKLRHKKTHPATRCFQALRIAVNQELTILAETLPLLFDLLEVNGRLAVISFHSLEDRIVKRAFNKLKMDKLGSVLTKKPIIANKEELESNRLSRSAKLRVIAK